MCIHVRYDHNSVAVLNYCLCSHLSPVSSTRQWSLDSALPSNVCPASRQLHFTSLECSHSNRLSLGFQQARVRRAAPSQWKEQRWHLGRNLPSPEAWVGATYIGPGAGAAEDVTSLASGTPLTHCSAPPSSTHTPATTWCWGRRGRRLSRLCHAVYPVLCQPPLYPGHGAV